MPGSRVAALSKNFPDVPKELDFNVARVNLFMCTNILLMVSCGGVYDFS